MPNIEQLTSRILDDVLDNVWSGDQIREEVLDALRHFTTDEPYDYAQMKRSVSSALESEIADLSDTVRVELEREFKVRTEAAAQVALASFVMSLSGDDNLTDWVTTNMTSDQLHTILRAIDHMRHGGEVMLHPHHAHAHAAPAVTHF